jgi:tRNA(adenine34) deaminase
MIEHKQFMRRAIEVAGANPRHPFGAVIVDTEAQSIVAEGVNRSCVNPILHGEIDAIEKCAATEKRDWRRLILYTTAEPCPMCMSAILWSGISAVVFGTSILLWLVPYNLQANRRQKEPDVMLLRE